RLDVISRLILSVGRSALASAVHRTVATRTTQEGRRFIIVLSKFCVVQHDRRERPRRPRREQARRPGTRGAGRGGGAGGAGGAATGWGRGAAGAAGAGVRGGPKSSGGETPGVSRASLSSCERIVSWSFPCVDASASRSDSSGVTSSVTAGTASGLLLSDA